MYPISRIILSLGNDVRSMTLMAWNSVYGLRSGIDSEQVWFNESVAKRSEDDECRYSPYRKYYSTGNQNQNSPREISELQIRRGNRVFFGARARVCARVEIKK